MHYGTFFERHFSPLLFVGPDAAGVEDFEITHIESHADGLVIEFYFEISLLIWTFSVATIGYQAAPGSFAAH